MKQSTICFLVTGEHILLSNKKRGFGAGYLNGYGGKVGEGETIDVSVVRELEEEAGVTVNPDNLEQVGIVEFYERENPVFECSIFFVRTWEGEVRESEEMALPESFPMDALPFDRMWDADKAWLSVICRGEKIHAKVIYKEGMKEMDRLEYEPLAECKTPELKIPLR